MRFIAGLCSFALVAAVADTRLADAVQRGDQRAVHFLLQQKADVNAAQGDGMTALHWAAFNDDLETAKMLIAAGANIKAATRDGAITPLLIACTNGNAPVIEALLKGGANANSVSAEGATALMKAAVSGSADAVNVLLAHGASVNATDTAHGQTALMFAAAEDRAAAIKVLMAQGADSKMVTKSVSLEKPTVDDDGNPIKPRPTPKPGDLVGAALAGRRVAPHIMGGLTALHFAARDGRVEAVRALVEAGVDVESSQRGQEHTHGDRDQQRSL